MTHTQKVILWGLAALLLVVVGGLSYVLVQRPAPVTAGAQPAPGTPPLAPPPADSYRLPETPYTARNIYDQAAQAALLWQQDAALVSVATSWPFADLDGFSQPVDWTFQFYSPDTQGMYTFSIGNAEVTPIRETLAPYSLPTVELGRWTLDSHQALNAWLNRGGGHLMRGNPVVNVNARLRVSEEGLTVWTVAGTTSDGQTTLSLKLNAVGGEVLP